MVTFMIIGVIKGQAEVLPVLVLSGLLWFSPPETHVSVSQRLKLRLECSRCFVTINVVVVTIRLCISANKL